MKRLAILLLAAALAAAPAAAQTIKSLGYNATNGFIVYSGTNSLTFTNALQFETNARAATRTNLGATSVGDAVFTATNAEAAATAIGLGATNFVSFDQILVMGTLMESGILSTGEYFFATDDENSASSVFLFDGEGAQQLRANARESLGLGFTALTNTNVTNFRTAIGLGDWATLSDGSALRSENLNISDGEDPNYIQFTAGTGVIFNGNRDSQFRSALGLGFTALTNTSNVTMMRALAGSTNTNQPFSGSISVVGTNNTNTLVFSNGILLEAP